MTKQNLTRTEKFGFGLGDTASNIVYQAVINILLYFYTDVYGIEAAAAGTLLLVVRIFDAITDPAMGAIADRTRSKHGRYRPWMLWVAIPYGALAVAAFFTPDVDMGTKLVYAVCRVTHPNGRIETATATVPLVDPVNVLMKAETKAKRRATLSILGLGVLDEMELETIPANVQEPGGGVDLSQATMNMPSAAEEEPPAKGEVPVEAPPQEIPAALEGFHARVAEIELPGEAVAVWMKHRAELAALSAAEREAAWKALCKKTEEVGKMKNAKVWLKKAIAEEDARRTGSSTGSDNQAA